jgi:hypothetical protein
MSEQMPAPTALITIEPQAYVTAVYEPFEKAFHDAVVAYKDVTYVITTKVGMETAKRARATFRDIRINGEKRRVERKAPIIEIGKLLDSRYKEIAALVAPYETRFDTDIQAEERRLEDDRAAKIKAEAERNSAIQIRIDEIKNAPLTALNQSAQCTQVVIDALSAIVPNKDVYGERFVEAEVAIKTSIDQLALMLSGKLAQEQLAAQQEAQRIENERLAEIAAKEKLEAEARLCAEQAAEAERIKTERAELDRQRAELAKQQEAIDAHSLRIQEEEAKAKAKIEAEALAKSQAEDAAKKEAEAKDNEKAEADAKAKRIQDDLDAARSHQKKHQSIYDEEIAKEKAVVTVAAITPQIVADRIVTALDIERVTISKDEYDSLKKDSEILNCLRACGVDNWEGWDDSWALFEERHGNENMEQAA